ncbi:hypothetical protein RRG08_056173 [Elysia crispata]|uniref:Uncharacterized protein n=1 Tax=Elysia crispata TaxID=231223 RepID=A0AAE0Z0Z7_9GAST|nr:hypothetical protein RRG08_056173 [Elysia crispata]
MTPSKAVLLTLLSLEEAIVYRSVRRPKVGQTELRALVIDVTPTYVMSDYEMMGKPEKRVRRPQTSGPCVLNHVTFVYKHRRSSGGRRGFGPFAKIVEPTCTSEYPGPDRGSYACAKC